MSADPHLGSESDDPNKDEEREADMDEESEAWPRRDAHDGDENASACAPEGVANRHYREPLKRAVDFGSPPARKREPHGHCTQNAKDASKKREGVLPPAPLPADP